MKTIFTLNFVNKSIVGTKSAITRANKCLEPEYSELCALLEKHPNFKVEVKKIEQKKEKKTYTGLTFDVMKTYISTLEDSDKKLVEFEKVMKVAAALGAKYPVQDCSRGGTYHNKHFKASAEAHPLLDAVVDRFGTTDFQYAKVDDTHFSVSGYVEISDQFFGWLLGFGNKAKLLYPDNTIQELSDYLDKIRSLY